MMASKVKRKPAPPIEFDSDGLSAVSLAFSHKFGRPPSGSDPVFFDPKANEPCSLPRGGMQRLLLEAMLESGTSPEIVYAFCRTGVAVFEERRSDVPSEQLSLWDTAISEYEAFENREQSVLH